MEAYKTIVGENYKLEIVYDEFPDSPRAWDNLSTVYFSLPYKHLGDGNELNIDEIEEIASCKDNIVIPLYLYEHTGITVKAAPFTNRCDLNADGFAILTKEKIEKEGLAKKKRETLIKYIVAEIEILDEYIRGNVFGYVLYEKKLYKKTLLDRNLNEVPETFKISEEWEEMDSTWGFYGDNFEKDGMFECIDKDILKELSV